MAETVEATIQTETTSASVAPADTTSIDVAPASGSILQLKPSDQTLVGIRAQTSELAVGPAPVTRVTVNAGGSVNVLPANPTNEFSEWVELSYTADGINSIRTLNPGEVVTEVTISVLEIFDGGATLLVGTVADTDLWLDLGVPQLAILCQYTSDEIEPISVSEALRVILASSSSTQGRVGLLYRIQGAT